MRRLYQTQSGKYSFTQILESEKHFLEAYRRYGDEPRFRRLIVDILQYDRALSDVGLRDHQAKLFRSNVVGI